MRGRRYPALSCAARHSHASHTQALLQSVPASVPMETTMIVLSAKAEEFLNTCFKNQNPKPELRVYAIPGPMLILAMDKARVEDDDIEEKGGFTFCMTKELRRMVREVEIDVGTTGFTCTPLIPLPAGSCSGGCSSCSGCH